MELILDALQKLDACCADIDVAHLPRITHCAAAGEKANKEFLSPDGFRKIKSILDVKGWIDLLLLSSWRLPSNEILCNMFCLPATETAGTPNNDVAEIEVEPKEDSALAAETIIRALENEKTSKQLVHVILPISVKCLKMKGLP